jgi:Ca2+:H+ antiporter
MVRTPGRTTMSDGHKVPRTATAFPAAALVLVMAAALVEPWLERGPAWLAATALPVLATVLLVGCVFAALHHAEVVAARVGEPWGTLTLTLSVTVIEVALVASMMLNEENNPTLAREAVFSVVIIVCTGLTGLCLFIGAIKHYEQGFQPQGTAAYLTVIMALAITTLLLPNYTETTPGPIYSTGQLIFVSIASILLYGAFLFVQTVRHRSDFAELPRDAASQRDTAAPRDASAPRDARTLPSVRVALIAFAGLVASLLGVILLAERVAAGVESGLARMPLKRPDAIAGAVIALLVLMPEGLAAVRAAARNALQTSINIALGSALATIGLTIPAITAVSVMTTRPIVLGLDPRDQVMLLLAFAISVVSFGTGRTNVLSGMVHLVVFATFVLFLFSP